MPRSAACEPDLTLPDLILPGKTESDVKGQAEFTRTPAEYLNVAYLARLGDQGKALLVKHRDALEKIERELGVQRQVVLAIWGRETAFGAHRSPHYAIQALATQAWLGRRKDMFRNELVYALKMLEDGVRTRDTMKSSWAGAMGLTQFMPSEYYTLAYDLDGDGRKDIWGSVPDALASAANQLRDKGWVAGQPWGYEVRLPTGTTCLIRGPAACAHGARMGEARGRAHAGARVPGRHPRCAGLHPRARPARTAPPSWRSRTSWSSSATTCRISTPCSSATSPTASAAAAISMRRGPTCASSRRAASRRSRSICRPAAIAISKVDGKAGMNTRALIGAYQQASKLKVDCWPSEALLTHLRSAPANKAGAAPKQGSLSDK